MHPRGRLLRTLPALGAALLLGGCGASHDGYLAVALDPAGRLLAVVALCEGQQLVSVTLTDETTGTSTTAYPDTTPEPGGSLILTAPIDNPRPEGALDLLDRGHEYTLHGMVRAGDDDPSPTSSVRFKLDTVVRAKALRTGSVYAGAVGGDDPAGSELARDDFVGQVRDECD